MTRDQKIEKKIIMFPNDLICECKTAEITAFNFLLQSHDSFELFLFLEGEMVFYTEDSVRKIKRGDLVCIPPYTFHRGELQTPELYTRIVININPELLLEYSTDKTNLAAFFHQNAAERLFYYHLTEEEISQYQSYAFLLEKVLRFENFGDDVLAEAYIKQILVMLNRMPGIPMLPEYLGKTAKLVSDTFSYIEEHITEKIRLNDIADYLHYDRSYISKSFKKIIGVSVQQYIIIKRVAMAQQFLRKGYAPHDVCFMTGFNNYSHFSRTFLNHVGYSPKQYQLNSK